MKLRDVKPHFEVGIAWPQWLNFFEYVIGVPSPWHAVSIIIRRQTISA